MDCAEVEAARRVKAVRHRNLGYILLYDKGEF